MCLPPTGFVWRMLSANSRVRRQRDEAKAAKTATWAASMESHQDTTQLQQQARATGELDGEHLATASDGAFRCLRALASALDPPGAFDLDAAIIQWPGPSFTSLAAAWLRPKRAETPAQRLRFASKSTFDDALLLFEILVLATGEGHESLEHWKTAQRQRPRRPQPHVEAKRRSRRPRRRRRR